MIVVDSSVWIDYFNGRHTRETDVLNDILGVRPILMGDLILTEVLQGFRADNDYKRALEALGTLDFAPMVGRDIAISSAANYRALRRNGVTIRKTIDVLIGTFCIENAHQLLQSDIDYTPMVKHLGLVVL